ncbi:hypothetical protein COV49_01205 [Candidatus Falkowbacteria bacterium CG11_big_fil_rev_8_21_14_0_20_39_10]|uniref:Uncharacterized protein n=1 Tax=Candidatus Falkowbacteria bacterium CG11_big_fil_rev_8_21_14_0_20_39_10 TaxID=1974570 RepID=A0A2M6KA17_9BACT|nr:MAG: hypothetical protein COV49_01205 [Candidatus Falkowbacteria bacterium CG11_big_fil_rev_8_21_14_0_20_39_10]
MKKKSVKNILKIAKYVIIPTALFSIFIGLTIFQIISNDGSLSVITQKYSQKYFPEVNNEAILAGEKRVFEFTATHDNLGFISINFDIVGKGREDYIDLRIYEKKSKKIIKEETTFAAAFQGLNYYPFGFPIIPDSKGKTYVVEIKSKQGSPKNYVAIKDAKSIFSTSYQYDKNKITSDKKYFINFILNKGLNSLENNFLLFTTSVYLYPFVFYILWLFLEKRFRYKLSKYRLPIHNLLVALLVIAVITDIFFVDSGIDLVFLLISILWGVILMYLKKESVESYKVALALLILAPILQLLGQDLMVEKAAAWAFLALTVGVIINLYELRKDSQTLAEKK